MTADISVVIPAHNEEDYIERCLVSVRSAEQQISEKVEIVVVLNRCTDNTEAIARKYSAVVIAEDAKNLSKIRNAGVKASSGRILITIDADSWMSDNMLHEVSRRLNSGRYIGGGVRIKPERMSLGIFFSSLTFVPKLILQRRWAGMFWMYRDTFDASGGFNEELVSVEDVDLARRLKDIGLKRGLRYGMIMRAFIVTSCRKFDHFGDWFLFRNRQVVTDILSGSDQKAADRFYYDFKRVDPNESNRNTN